MALQNGYDTIKIISGWERKHGTRLPIVATIAYAMRGDEQECLAAGMDAYLLRPINLDRMAEMLNKFTRRTEKQN